MPPKSKLPDVAHFKTKRIGANKVVAAIGKSGSGKSRVIYNLLQSIKPDLMVVFAGTVGAYELAMKCVPEALVIQGFSEAVLRNLHEMMVISKTNPHLGLPETIEIVFDDLGTSGVLRKNKFLQHFFTEARHYGFGVKLMIHTAPQVLPEARSSFHVSLLYRCHNFSDLGKLHKYFSMVNFATFTEYMNNVAKNHRALVIDNMDDTPEEKVLAWYKANISKELKTIGRADVLEFCRVCCKQGSGWSLHSSTADQRVMLEGNSDAEDDE